MKKIPMKVPAKALHKALNKPAKETEKERERKQLQKSYDDECRKLNAARETQSIDAIRLCGDNIKALKEQAAEAGVVIAIASDESFGTDKPYVHITKEGEAVFVCGGVNFKVDIKDLNKALGTNGNSNPLDRLMDSQISSLGRSMGLSVDPFVSELLKVPIQGLVQLCWYRDIEKHESKHLEENQQSRIDTYLRRLSQWHASEDETNGEAQPRKQRSSSGKNALMNRSFVYVKGDHKEVASGRETDLLQVMKTFKKPVTFSEIVTAAQGKVKTKQDFEAIIARFLKELLAHNAVREA